jgi:ATP-dependent DNA ligase
VTPAVKSSSPSANALRSRRSRRRRKQGLANFEGIVSKRLGSRYRSGRSKDWLKFKNAEAPAVKRKAEEDWGKRH